MKTLKQVAAAAGVHPATAAAVLNAARGNTRVAEATRRRILAVARRLGYVRNEAARRLKTGQSNAVGFIGGDLRNPFFAELAACLEEELARRDFQLVVAHVAAGSGTRFRQALEVLQQQRVRGIVYWDESPRGRQGSAPVPLVPIGFTTHARPGVWLDLQRAIRLAVEHFEGNGLRRLGFYAPRRHQESPSVVARRQIFLEECRDRGLPAPVVATFDGESWDVAAAARGASVLLAERLAVQAWLGFNDTASLGLLLARETAKSRPEVICFDGTRLARNWPTPAPWLDLKVPEMARQAVAILAGERHASATGLRESWLRPELHS
jgi:LacI family transcriptional regulator